MTPIDISILGPLLLHVDDTEVAVTRARVRGALALFAVVPAHTVTRSALIDHLWGSSLPADPNAALSVVLSRVRKALGAHRDRLETGPSGYRLDMRTDSERFEYLIAQARNADVSDARKVADSLATALSMWRGEPLLDVTNSDHVRPLIAALNELRWNAITLRSEALLETQSYDELIAFAEPLAREQPHRERLVACCARALGLAGRKSHALGLIDHSRTSLLHELGVSASPALLSIESALLRGGLDLMPNETSVTQGPATHFVNRSTELQTLAESNGLTVVVGEPGIGKSALLSQARRAWLQNGRQVFEVRAPLSPTRPMHTLSVLIEELVASVPPKDTEIELRSALAKVVPGVADPVKPSLTAVTRDTLVASLTEYIGRCAQSTNGVLVIDDCQWLDLISADVVDRLAEQDRCRLILATRQELDGPLALRVQNEPERVLAVGALSQTHSREALRSALPHASADHVEQIWKRSGGNPLFLSLLIDLDHEGQIATDELPSSVLIAVQRRIEVLSSRAQATLQRVALAGSTAPLSVVRQLSPTADADIDEALTAGLLIADTVHDTVEFNHALIREGVMQFIPEGQRVALHDQIGQIYEFTGAPAATYAFHYEQALALDSGRVARALLIAATEAAQVYAWEDAYAMATKAKQYLEPGDDLIRARLAILAGQAQRDLHQGGSADDLSASIKLARELGDDELFAETVLAQFIHGWEIDSSETQQPLELLEEALELDVTNESSIRLAATGATLMSTEQHQRGRALFHQAFEQVLAHPDASLQAHVLELAHWGFSHPHDLGAFDQAIKLFRAVAGSDRHLRWGVATSEFALGIVTVDAPIVEASITELRSIAASLGPSVKDWELAHTEMTYAHVAGDYDRADHFLAKALELGSVAASMQWLLPIYGACLATLRRSQGRLAETLDLVDGAMGSNPGFSGWHAVAASAAASVGDRERARTEVNLASPKGDFSELRPVSLTGEISLLCDAICAIEDVDLASQMFAFASPFAGRMTWAGVCTYGPLDRSLGQLAQLLGHDQQANELCAAADTAEAALARLATW